jgi:two-component system chemotaxis response regulator CheB
LFRSGAEHAGRNAVGLLMTGMGSDGARGLLAMRQAGARTLAQDEESCVVFGMPQAAVKMGAVDRVVGLQSLPQALLQAIAEPVAP